MDLSLISPPDSAFLNNPLVDMDWTMSDRGFPPCRFMVVVDSADTFYTSDTTLSLSLAPGWHNWFVCPIGAIWGIGDPTSTWHFEVDTAAPAQITLISPDSASELQVLDIPFSWNPVSKSPVRYVIEVDSSASFSSGLYQIDTVDITSDTLTVPLDHTWYYWRVMAYDLAGNTGPWSSIWSFYTNTTDTKETAVPKTFFLRVGSNPSRTGDFSFGVPFDSKVQLRAYDASGRVVWSEDASYQPGTYHGALNLKPGVSFLRMTANSFNAVRKLIIR